MTDSFAERCRRRRRELRQLLVQAHPDHRGDRKTYDRLIEEYQTLRRCQYTPCGKTFKIGTNSGQLDQRFCSQCCGSRYRAERKQRRLKGQIMRLTTAVLLGALLVAVDAFAQAPAPPNTVEILVIPAVGDPVTVAPVAARQTPISQTASVCNLASLPGAVTPLVNPTMAYFNDPFNAGRFCGVPLPTIGTIPNGDYRAVGVFISDSCEVGGVQTANCRSPRSAVGIPPFSVSRVGPPAAPTGLVVRP